MSETEDERLREAFRKGDGPRGEPVDPDTLWAVVQGEADEETAAALADRLAADPDLLEDWNVARVFGEAAAEDAKPAAQPAAANTGAYRWWLGLTAAAAAILLAVLLWPRPGALEYDPADGQIRTGSEDALRSTVEGPLRADAATLSWAAVDGASSYVVHVTTEDLEPVFDAEDLTDATVTIDAASLADLPAGTTLMWRVEAVMSDGTRRRSATFSVELE